MWEYESPEGKSIARALDFITPYLLNKELWPYPPDVMHFNAFPARHGFLLLAGCTMGRQELLDLYYKLPKESQDEEARRNIASRQPMLWI